MSENEFGINYKVQGLGNLRSSKEYKSLHGAKSVAGKRFHNPAVQSVCVFDASGTAWLYLKKTPDGVVREEL
jgi:hypothetical protein